MFSNWEKTVLVFQVDGSILSEESCHQIKCQIMHFQIDLNWKCRCDTELSNIVSLVDHCMCNFHVELIQPSQVPDHAFSTFIWMKVQMWHGTEHENTVDVRRSLFRYRDTTSCVHLFSNHMKTSVVLNIEINFYINI